MNPPDLHDDDRAAYEEAAAEAALEDAAIEREERAALLPDEPPPEVLTIVDETDPVSGITLEVKKLYSDLWLWLFHGEPGDQSIMRADISVRTAKALVLPLLSLIAEDWGHAAGAGSGYTRDRRQSEIRCAKLLLGQGALEPIVDPDPPDADPF